MRLLAKFVLRHRARQNVLNALRFAERLRKQNSEFAPSYQDTINGIGDELALLARNTCRSDAERRALLEGLMAAFKKMYRTNPTIAQRIGQRLAPRILESPEQRAANNAWMQIAV